MRKNLLFIGLALSMLAVGCNNGPEEETKKPSSGKKNVTVTANATLPEGLTWAEGDVYLVNGVEAPALGAEANGLQTVALTVSNPDSTSPVIVLGPSALRTGASEVTVGDVQKYVADGYDRSVFVLAGGAAEALPVEEDNKNVLAADVEMACFQGFLTLPLTLEAEYAGEAPVAIEQITLTALNNEALCGAYSVSLAKIDGNLVPAIKASEAKSAIDLVCEEPVVLGAEAVNFNVVLPVGSYKGFEFVVNDTEGRKYVFNVETEVAIDANAYTALETVAYKVVEKAPVTLNVTIAESGVVWAEGDAIVCNNELSSVVASSSVGTSTATFELQSVAYPYSVFYPADLYSKAGSVRFAEEQPLMKNAFDRSNIVMIGYSATTDVEMKNLCGIVSLPIQNKFDGDDVVIENIEVASLNGEALSGKYHINYRNCTVSPVSPRTSINLVPAEGETVVLTPGEETAFSFVVPVGTYPGGLHLTLTTNLGVFEKTVSASGVTVRAGETATLESYVYEDVKIPFIDSVELLMDFVKSVNAGRYKKFVNEEGKVLLGADLDMSGVAAADWVSIGVSSEHPFDGIFDGQGFSIKNWNTTEPFFYYNTGVIENLNVDASCSYTVATKDAGDKNCALLVGYNHTTGVVRNCVNNANITATDISCAGHRIAGLIGASYGIVSGCTNNGNVKVESKSVGNNQNIGGLIGYLNPNAGGKESLGADIVVDCVNTGNVTVTFNCQPKKTCVGGVVGGTQLSKTAEAVLLGTIKNCKNTGSVYYTFTTLNSGTYANVGGVVGYSQANMDGCVNEGKVTYVTPTDTSVAGTRPACGGVVGCALYSLKNSDNKGEVVVDGVWAAGSEGEAGAGTYHGAIFGGVAGGVGNKAYTAGLVMENCNNYGKVDIFNRCKDAGGTKCYIGGLVGGANVDIINCHNNGETIIKTNTYETQAGGIVGYTGGGIDNCSVNVKCEAEIVGVSKTGGNQYFAGIAGYSSKKVTNCTLNAPIKFTVTDASAGSLRCAGIVGQVKTLDSSAKVVAIENCKTTDKASITYVGGNTKANYIGGIIGLCNDTVKDCVNVAPISVTMSKALTSTDITYIAGIVGKFLDDMEGCSNSGTIVADMCQSTAPLYSAGLAGTANAAACIINNNTNTGNVTINNAGNTDFINPIIGKIIDGMAVTNTTDTGVYTVNGTVK